MTGKPEKNKRCPLCGGRLTPGIATVPFLLRQSVVVVKNVPGEICVNCNEPYTTGPVTDQLVNLLAPLRALQAEVLIVSYPALEAALAQNVVRTVY